MKLSSITRDMAVAGFYLTPYEQPGFVTALHPSTPDEDAADRERLRQEDAIFAALWARDDLPD